ncbi:MAG TPA: carboxyl transferase domain-containing protein [Tepidiformaceae bacterium]|nr:carboxyl transferase domain-containing protein [Tepidiformaceae bacterium]
MTWEPELREMERRIELATHMGGAENVQRQHDGGKLTIRERLERLVDPGSFTETGVLAGKPEYDADGNLVGIRPANYVMGFARLNGRRVVVGGDDFTVRGGAGDASIGGKQGYAEKMARELRMPIVRLVDGTGGGGSVRSLTDIGRTYVPANPVWDTVVDMLNEVPVVAAAMGSVAGLGAARVVTAHWSIMVKDTSQVFVAGPPVVARGMGEEVTKEELGGAQIHYHNGVCDNLAEDEDDAFRQIRQFLIYLPQNAWELPHRCEPNDDPDRREEMLLSAIPRNRRRPYKVREILEAVLDRGSFFEIGGGWGRSVVTGFGRLDGYPVGIVSNDPYHYGGGLTADGSEKMERMVDLCDTFHVPAVNFLDQPGFVIGTAGEKAATIRKGARVMTAVFQARVPWVTILMRRAFGVAGAAHANTGRLNLRYAWPSGDWGSLPLEGGIEAAYKRDLANSPDPDALRAEIEAKMNAVRSPFRTAEAFGIEHIIDPRETRPILCEWVHQAYEVAAHELGPRSHGYRP